MYMDTYTAEKLMQQRRLATEKQSRTAWMVSETKPVRPSLFSKVIASYTNKKSAVTTVVSDACCNCCAVNA